MIDMVPRATEGRKKERIERARKGGRVWLKREKSERVSLCILVAR